MDCGSACLSMIVEYYDVVISQDGLKQDCETGKSGVSLLGISKAAEKIGMRTVGGMVSLHSLIAEKPLPCIAHWDQNHFVVIYKIKKQRKGDHTIYVADPGKGLLTYNKAEFCEHWASTKINGEEKGVVLLLEPTENFYTQNSTKQASKRYHP